MKKITGILRLLKSLPISMPKTLSFSDLRPFVCPAIRSFSTDSHELKEFMEYMEKLKNYEKIGVPKDAGTDSDDGFDLGRMRRLLHNLGNPHSKFKVGFS